jgi:hypothetical protein
VPPGTAPSNRCFAIHIGLSQACATLLFRYAMHVGEGKPSLAGALGTSTSHQVMNVGYLLKWTMLRTDNGDLRCSVDDPSPAVVVSLAVGLT